MPFDLGRRHGDLGCGCVCNCVCICVCVCVQYVVWWNAKSGTTFNVLQPPPPPPPPPPMIPSQRRTYMFLDLSLCAAVRAARSTIRVRLFGSMHPTKREHGSRTAHPNIVKQLGSHSLSLRVLIWVTTCSVHHLSIILLSPSLLSKKRAERACSLPGLLFFLDFPSLSSSP